MVRAKIAAIQHNSDRVKLHIGLALTIMGPRTPLIIAMCGYSGSGKSFVSSCLIEAVPCIRIRSDVERKRMAGLKKVVSALVEFLCLLNLSAVGALV